MTDSNIPVFRAQLRYESVDEFIEGYSQFVLPDKMFIPLDEAQLKSTGSRVRFEFKLADGSRAMVGEGLVRQVRGPDQGPGPTGLVVEYTHLSRRSKQLIGQIVDLKRARARSQEPAEGEPADPEASSESRAPSTPADEAASAHSPPDEQPTGDAHTPASSSSPGEPAQSSSDSDDAAADPDRQSEASQPAGVQSEPSIPIEATPDARAEYEEFNDLDDISDAYGQQPKQVGETEGGLQIMAYDDMSEEDAEEFAEFALGSDEDDVDQMFDDVLSGGGGEGDDLFGGGEAAGEAMFGGNEDVNEEPVLDPDEAAESDLGEISSAIDDELDEPASEDPDANSRADSLDAEEFSSANLAEDTSAQDQGHAPPPEAPNQTRSDATIDHDRDRESGLSELSEEMASSDTGRTDFESDDPTTIEADTDPQELSDLNDDPAESQSDPREGETGFSGFQKEESDELDQALDSLEEESDDERELSLSLGGASGSDDPKAQSDDSLEALVADEQKNLRGDGNQDDQKDALDEVLGNDTPPPPSDDFDVDLPNERAGLDGSAEGGSSGQDNDHSEDPS